MDQQETGRFIARLRNEKGMTQAELGEKLGVTNKTVSRWENGNYMPDISLLQSLCGELGVGVNELLSGRRLEDGEFRQRADENMISSLKREKTLRREKSFSEFLSGGGTGMLISATFSPPTPRRIATVAAAILMVVAGWFLRAKYEKQWNRKA